MSIIIQYWIGNDATCGNVYYNTEITYTIKTAQYVLDADNCASNPCQNGGTCTDELNQYNCTCVDGYTGDHCETSMNACFIVLCMSSVHIHVRFLEKYHMMTYIFRS